MFLLGVRFCVVNCIKKEAIHTSNSATLEPEDSSETNNWQKHKSIFKHLSHTKCDSCLSTLQLTFLLKKAFAQSVGGGSIEKKKSAFLHRQINQVLLFDTPVFWLKGLKKKKPQKVYCSWSHPVRDNYPFQISLACR